MTKVAFPYVSYRTFRNFLELLKVSILEKVIALVEKQKFPLEQSVSYKNEIKEDIRNIKISVDYFSNSVFQSKKKIDYDSLFIFFNESSNIDIYKDEKNFKSLILYKNSGISIPKDTMINSSFIKNLLLIEINNII